MLTADFGKALSKALNRAKSTDDSLFAEIVNHHASMHDEHHSNTNTVTGN